MSLIGGHEEIKENAETQRAQRYAEEYGRRQEELGDSDFFVGAEGIAHGVADFAEGGVGLHGVDDERHQVFFALARFAQRGKLPCDGIARSFRAQFTSPLARAMTSR